MQRRILSWIGMGLIVIAAVFAVVYLWDINQAYKRVQSRGAVISTPYGDIEYTSGGSGPDVLVIHGSGGGYDQGELLVQAVLSDKFRWITPSRFGYLRSTFHDGATWDDQARAYAFLLDRLGLKKVAVVALSHGGPSALLFAILFPERVSSLTLLSCGVASSAASDQAEANKKGDMLKMIFQHDLLYWTTTKLFKKKFMGLMGATDAVVDSLTPQQRKLAEQVIDYMNPVSPRSAGVTVDNTAKMPNERIAAIQAPTLVVHATDDMLQLYHNAEFAASTIPGAKLSRFERGGHLLMVVEQTAIRPIVQKHIVDNMNR
ncbi:MAG: alpha/beta hydrolase [Candidatus Omnitrophota bacterium]|jgi:pimeloyl-ACP methyl ester carboxylesterase